MEDLRDIAPALVESEPGFWTTAADEPVSYPTDGHKVMVQIEEQSFWFAHRADVLGTVLRRYPPPGCVFDVGGGNGFMVREIRSRGLEAILIEPGEDGARSALDRGLAPVVNATLNTGGFLPNSLDAVGLFDVLEHIESEGEFLEHLWETLRPDGRLYLTVPAHNWLWSVDDVNAGHHRRYSRKALERVLTHGGFVVEFTSYLFAFLPIPILVVRSLPSLLGARSGRQPRTDEHRVPSNVFGRLFQWSLKRELATLRNRRVWFGSSLIVVAKKASE